MIELSIVTGTYKRFSLLQRMVYSVRGSIAPGVPYEIVVVGVEGDDESLAWCREQDDIVLIVQPGLLGAIKAFGEGFRKAQGRYVVVGGDDCQYLGDTLTRALVYMHSHPEVGIGCFYQDRSGQRMHVSPMPAHYPDGRATSVIYGQKCILRRDLGDECGWWGDQDPVMQNARTYGGDCFLSAQVLEMGLQVIPIEGCNIHEETLQDEINKLNNPPTNDGHPDTQLYLHRFPMGPELGHPATELKGKRPMRILYAPIYEVSRYREQQMQSKNGLRRALQRIGLVWEVDYLNPLIGANGLLHAAELWQPDLVYTQFHDANVFNALHAARLKEIVPNALLVNWNGDVYPRDDRPGYCEMLRRFTLHTCVSLLAAQRYAECGVASAYLQLGYEPDGVDWEPLPDTPAYDVLFLGNAYSANRHAFGNFLQALPYKVGLYGDYWKIPHQEANLYNFAEGCRLYQNSKIALSDNQWWEHTAFVSNRMFQAMAAGGCLVMQQTVDKLEDMLGLEDGKHYVAWTDEQDLQEKIAYYLTHENERRAIANCGQLEVLRNHSFDHRLDELFDLLKQVQGETPDRRDPTLTMFYEARHG